MMNYRPGAEVTHQQLDQLKGQVTRLQEEVDELKGQMKSFMDAIFSIVVKESDRAHRHPQ